MMLGVLLLGPTRAGVGSRKSGCQLAPAAAPGPRGILGAEVGEGSPARARRIRTLRLWLHIAAGTRGSLRKKNHPKLLVAPLLGLLGLPRRLLRLRPLPVPPVSSCCFGVFSLARTWSWPLLM